MRLTHDAQVMPLIGNTISRGVAEPATVGLAVRGAVTSVILHGSI